MVTPKCVVCTCEDVTDTEILDAVEDGYRDLESLKRYTGLATGPCQGKACLALTIRLLSERLGFPPEEVGTITFRPPLQPVPLRFLAGDDVDADGDERRVTDKPMELLGDAADEEVNP